MDQVCHNYLIYKATVLNESNSIFTSVRVFSLILYVIGLTSCLATYDAIQPVLR